jgi:hypothetical protein
MPAMSKLVKAVRRRLETNRTMQEKMARIQDQITTISKA